MRGIQSSDPDWKRSTARWKESDGLGQRRSGQVYARQLAESRLSVVRMLGLVLEGELTTIQGTGAELYRDRQRARSAAQLQLHLVTRRSAQDERR